MSITSTSVPTATDEMEYVTFRAGKTLMGVSIRLVDEINRHVEVTPVPHAPHYVRGVINLRGEVVTVVDLRMILGLPPAELTKQTCTVVVHSDDEPIGLLVDQIGDVVRAQANAIDPPPANIGGTEGRFLKGVYKLDKELLIILDINAVLGVEAATR